jgi:hypothetical protein
MVEPAIERVLNILPTSVDRAACRHEVSEAIRTIGEVRIFAEPRRQLRRDSKKLIAAKRVIDRHLAAYGPCTGASDAISGQLSLLGTMLAELADAGERSGGQDRSVKYRRKYFAAERAFELLLRWDRSCPPTPTEGSDYVKLTAALYEAATNEEASDVTTACATVISKAEEDGYEPDKPERYLQHLRAARGIPI